MTFVEGKALSILIAVLIGLVFMIITVLTPPNKYINNNKGNVKLSWNIGYTDWRDIFK